MTEINEPESAGAMLQRLGADAKLWAEEFNKTAKVLGYSDMDEGWLIGWFANAIENTCVTRKCRSDLSAGQAQPDELWDNFQSRRFLHGHRETPKESFSVVFSSLVSPPAVPGEERAQLALIKHLAEYTTDKNWADKRLYIMQAVDRALSSPPSTAVAGGETTSPAPSDHMLVKPLVWKDHTDAAHTFLITTGQIGDAYHAFCENLMYFAYCGFTHIARASSIDEAKAAAQRDYEKRVLSALVPAPSQVSRGPTLAEMDAANAEAGAAAISAILDGQQNYNCPCIHPSQCDGSCARVSEGER